MRIDRLRLVLARTWSPTRLGGSAVVATAAIAAVFAAVFAVGEPGLAAATIVVVAGAVVLAIATARVPHVRVPVFLGFAARTGFAFVHRYVVSLPQSADARMFENRALRLAELPIQEHFARFDTGGWSVAWLTGWLYRIVGPEFLVGQLVMALLGALLIVTTCHLAMALGASLRMVLIVAWAMAFFPQPVLHSALLLREIPFALFVTIAAIQFVRWEKTRSPLNAAGGALAIIVAAAFHAGAIFLLLAAVVFVLVSSVGSGNAIRVILGALSFVVLVGFGWWVVSEEYGARQFGGDYFALDETFFEGEARGEFRGDAAFPAWLRITGPQDFWKTPLRLGLFLFAPFPWMVSNAWQALGLIDSTLYLIAAVLIVKGLRNARAIKRAASFGLILFMLGVGVLVFALGVGNYGTAIRHRAKFASYVVVLAVAGAQAGMLRARNEQDARGLERAIAGQQAVTIGGRAGLTKRTTS